MYYKFHSNAWKHIGAALGKTKTLVRFTAQACNLNVGENLAILFKGLQNNSSIKTLDFSDCELTDIHGQTILGYVKKHAERRDNDLWEISLRMSEADRHLKEQ